MAGKRVAKKGSGSALSHLAWDRVARAGAQHINNYLYDFSPRRYPAKRGAAASLPFSATFFCRRRQRAKGCDTLPTFLQKGDPDDAYARQNPEPGRCPGAQ